MLNKNFFVIAFLLLAAISTGWLAFSNLQTGGNNTPQDPNQPDSIMTNIHAIRMDEVTGKPHDELIAPHAEHFPYHDTTKITDPHFILYQENNVKPWYLTAHYGNIDNGINNVYLWDNVIFQQQQGPNNKASIINTTSVMIYPKQQYAETNQPVTAVQPGLIVHAIGMHVDFKAQIVNLLSQVTARYQSNQNNQSNAQ